MKIEYGYTHSWWRNVIAPARIFGDKISLTFFKVTVRQRKNCFGPAQIRQILIFLVVMVTWNFYMTLDFQSKASLMFFSIFVPTDCSLLNHSNNNRVDKKNQVDVTFCILYFSSNNCSTCFGQPCAHHQELTTAWYYSLVLVCAVAAGRWSSPVGR